MTPGQYSTAASKPRLAPFVAGTIQNADGGSAADELGTGVGQLGAVAGHVRAMSRHHVGRFSFLPACQSDRGRRTANAMVEA